MNRETDSSVMRIVKKIAKTKLSGVALQKMEQLATKVGVEEKELFQLYVESKNRSLVKNFASTPYNERILLLPQCLRSKDCPAELGNYGYECKECGLPIEPREYYYSVTWAGSGLGSIKFPDRVHMGCVLNFLNRRK